MLPKGLNWWLGEDEESDDPFAESHDRPPAIISIKDHPVRGNIRPDHQEVSKHWLTYGFCVGDIVVIDGCERKIVRVTFRQVWVVIDGRKVGFEPRFIAKVSK